MDLLTYLLGNLLVTRTRTHTDGQSAHECIVSWSTYDEPYVRRVVTPLNLTSWVSSTCFSSCCMHPSTPHHAILHRDKTVAGTRRPLCQWGRTIRAGRRRDVRVDVTEGRVRPARRPAGGHEPAGCARQPIKVDAVHIRTPELLYVIVSHEVVGVYRACRPRRIHLRRLRRSLRIPLRPGLSAHVRTVHVQLTAPDYSFRNNCKEGI